MKKTYWFIVAFILIILAIAGLKFMQPQSVYSGGQTKFTSGNEKCILYTGSRSCEVDKQYCNPNGGTTYRDDLSCFVDGERIGEVCFEGRTCTDTMIANCETNGKIDNCDLYCNLDNWVECPGGCNSEFKCEGGTKGCINPIGSTDDETCIDNNPYKCDGNTWQKTDTCGDFTCVEKAFNEAVCKYDNKWCLNDNRECITCSNGIYDTYEECSNNVPVYCLSTDRTKCIKRLGACLPGELTSKASSDKVALESCMVQVKDKKCLVDSECDDNNVCTIDECKKGILTNTCENRPIANCDQRTECEDETKGWFERGTWYSKITQKGGYMCSLFKIKCQQYDEGYCFKNSSLFMILVSVVLALGFITMLIIRKKKRR